jgi:hypothetical protein
MQAIEEVGGVVEGEVDFDGFLVDEGQDVVLDEFSLVGADPGAEAAEGFSC